MKDYYQISQLFEKTEVGQESHSTVHQSAYETYVENESIGTSRLQEIYQEFTTMRGLNKLERKFVSTPYL